MIFHLFVHIIGWRSYASNSQSKFIGSGRYYFHTRKCTFNSDSVTSMDFPVSEWNFIEKIQLIQLMLKIGTILPK